MVRGEEKAAVLIAARKDVATSLEYLFHEVHADHPYKEKGKDRMARSRTLISVQGGLQTKHWPSWERHRGGRCAWAFPHHEEGMASSMNEFWDRLAWLVKEFGINFIAGDFNMSLTEVPKQLRSRGIKCDCVAWYPWQQAAVADPQSQRLGFDSMGIFYLGGRVEVNMPWNHRHVQILAAVTDARNGANENLDVYAGANVPGQPWHCYRSKAYNENACNKDLEARLRDLLTPSTEPEELARLPRGKNYWHCPYLRLKQKK